MFRALGYAAVLMICAGVLAACGGSRHFTPTERAAFTAAQRKNNLLRIFPDRPGTISCRIPFGGQSVSFETGHCTTSVSMNAQRIRLDFLERFQGGSGGWTVVLDKHNRILGEHAHGEIPVFRN